MRAVLSAVAVARISDITSRQDAQHPGRTNAGRWSCDATPRGGRTNPPGFALTAASGGEINAAQCVAGMGVAEAGIARALEQAPPQFGRAPLLLLSIVDAGRPMRCDDSSNAMHGKRCGPGCAKLGDG